MDQKKVREAIETIKSNYPTSGYCMLCEALDTAIEALEKQLSKKVDIMDYPLGDINFRCPVCKSEYICEKEHEHFYCPTCGQKLDWTVEE
ncbi:MAG: hypothetical protein ACLTVN_11550 [Blautia hansenii]|uniref:hypothetical protein n=1 Tax=Blautia sp. TaxID=1955243 RepID=UPI003A2A476F